MRQLTSSRFLGLGLFSPLPLPLALSPTKCSRAFQALSRRREAESPQRKRVQIGTSAKHVTYFGGRVSCELSPPFTSQTTPSALTGALQLQPRSEPAPPLRSRRAGRLACATPFEDRAKPPTSRSRTTSRAEFRGSNPSSVAESAGTRGGREP